MRLLVLFVMSAVYVYGCSCRAPSVQEAVEGAEVVFRGSIVQLRPALEKSGLARFGDDTKAIAIFRVTRVWKGGVGPAFEMRAVAETSACVGFWRSFLKVGADLVVYATRIPTDTGREYATDICTRTRMAADAKDDLAELGVGEEPKKSNLPGQISK